jgi:DNA mismatch repair protein MutS
MAKKTVNSDGVVETPLMKQYYAIKAKYPDAILLFRVGDFYETFGEDAINASKILGIVLTKRANGSAAYIELAGFPYHSLDNYLPKLVRAGYRVAICEQLEDPKMTKTIVKRGVTELVTPGVTLNDNVLENKTNNFLCSIYLSGETCGVSFLDISTGEFLAGEGSVEYVKNLLQSLAPSEIIFQKSRHNQFDDLFGTGFHLFGMEEWIFDEEFTRDLLLKHFGTNNLKGFGIEDMKSATAAAGAIMHYLGETNHQKLQHVNTISALQQSNFVWLDNFTIRNLELLHSPHDKAITLFDILDRSITPMGSRLLRRWIAMPLKDVDAIALRLEVVDYFQKYYEVREIIQQQLKEVGDLERLTAKVATARVIPREIVQVKRGLVACNHIKNILSDSQNPALKKIGEQLRSCDELIKKIEAQIKEDAPVSVAKGMVFKEGVNAELDDLRAIAYSGKDYLVNMQIRESEKTGITSLKVGFNNVFGYYIEVTNSHKNKVPENWIRKQTLTNAERYITEELKEYETKILGAEEKILTLEVVMYEEFVQWLSQFIQDLQVNAKLLAQMDCLQSFATVSKENNYRRPEVNSGKSLTIIEGRHPVIEKALPVGESFVPNDLYLDEDAQQILVITGPNMSGKSALLRQTAIIVLMAQMGCFVPAKEARIGAVDKIFTRVGASDNLSQGESTFMVEMNETASILNNLSERSLILLDEIGRGTSTYDGISIAWSIAEFLHQHPKYRAKTLFATHYHELNEMALTMPRIKNFHVSVKEHSNKVIFLRKLVPGGSEHSFGIHVAKMAGMPREVLKKANEVLEQLEKVHHTSGNKNESKSVTDNFQLSFFQLEDPVLKNIKEEIENIDINTLTPVEALMKLNEIKKILGVKK